MQRKARNGTLEKSVSFDFVRYANCWEDADVLCRALRPAPGMRVLSICSAGDNALALAAAGADVVAADLSAPQLACLELRCAAFRTLDHEQVLRFLGVRPADDRTSTYQRMAGGLSRPARDHWDRHPRSIASGIIHSGKIEGYFRLFRRWFLPLIHSPATIRQLTEPKDRDQRREFWSTWNNRRWRLLFRVFFSRAMMGRLGRDPEFFRHVDGDVSSRFLKRTEHGLTELPTHDNPFLDYIVHGNFNTLPRYLREEQFDRVRAGIDRLTLRRGPIEHVGREPPADRFDAFNLSDIFEYLDAPAAESLYSELVSIARPGARLTYWNTLVPRGRPEALAGRVRRLAELSSELHAQDKAFFYGAFHVDEVD